MPRAIETADIIVKQIDRDLVRLEDPSLNEGFPYLPEPEHYKIEEISEVMRATYLQCTRLSVFKFLSVLDPLTRTHRISFSKIFLSSPTRTERGQL